MRRIFALIAVCALPALAQPAAASVKVGLLSCVVQPGTGFIVGSVKHFYCKFQDPDGRRTEDYRGTVKKFGLDIGSTSRTSIKWAVLAPSSAAYKRGALAGSYVGLSAEATAGVGVGANALVGGSNKTFTLQPVSVQGQQGLNLAVGVTSFELQSVR